MIRWLCALMVVAVGLFFVSPTSSRADEKKNNKPADEQKDEKKKDAPADKGDKPGDTAAADDHGFMGVMIGQDEDKASIQSVTDDSPAAKAGVKEGDEIVRIGDTAIKTRDDVITKMRSTKPGDKVTVTVKRDGKEHKLEITLGKMPPNPDR